MVRITFGLGDAVVTLYGLRFLKSFEAFERRVWL